MAQTTAFAHWLSGVANRPAVENYAVAKIGRVLWGKNLTERHFDFYGVFQIIHYAQTVCDPYAVGIHNGRAGNVENIA